MGDLFKLFIGLMLLAGVVNFFDFFNKYLRTPLSYFFQMIFIGGVRLVNNYVNILITNILRKYRSIYFKAVKSVLIEYIIFENKPTQQIENGIGVSYWLSGFNP